jgi:uncharacterized protein (TIGR04255 family)
MADRVKYRPFTGDGENRIRLQHAPLVLVLCQVRWPGMNLLQTDEQLRLTALQVGEKLVDFPLLSEAKATSYTITPEGLAPAEGGTIYQWASADDVWHMILAKRFMSLYCTEYESYDALSARLRQSVETLREVLSTRLTSRVSVRYVNRLSNQNDIADLGKLARPQVLGYQGVALENSGPALLSSVNQAVYAVGDSLLQVRSGLIPPGQTPDPAVAPSPSESWVLDLEAFQEGRGVFDVDGVMPTVSRLSDIAYDYFKLIATDEFIERFGEGRPDGRQA